jgi:hypothetical protein
MPNWCSNRVIISHDNAAAISKIAEAAGNNTLLNSIVPEPDNNEDWHSWRIGNWGTKWDVRDVTVLQTNENELFLDFLSAWSPPIEAFHALVEQGFKVDARYFEPGMCFTGIFTDVTGDEGFNIDEINPEWIKKNIPEELISEFALDDWAYQIQEENAEEQ